MQPLNERPIVVFDLDGTILRINSFPHWVVFLLVGSLPGLGIHRRLLLSLRTLALLLRRKLVRTSHDDLLWRLQHVWQRACLKRPPISLARFEAFLLRRVRSNMASVLALVAQGRFDAVLATAAADDYAAGLGRRLGFRHVLATPAGRARGDPANAGERKRECVRAWLTKQGWDNRPLLLFTDHLDDLPLMHDSHAVYWCGEAGVPAGHAGLVVCHELDDRELAARLLEACQAERTRASAA